QAGARRCAGPRRRPRHTPEPRGRCRAGRVAHHPRAPPAPPRGRCDGDKVAPHRTAAGILTCLAALPGVRLWCAGLVRTLIAMVFTTRSAIREGWGVLYWLLKYIILGPWLKLVFRPRVEGLEHVPNEGPVIIASNHLSFGDSIFMPLMVKRKVTFPAKSE